MASEILSPGFHFYQSANAETDRVKENFLVRLNEFEIITDDLKRQPSKGSIQHFLLIGRRGSGKSTLLRRLQIEIESTELSEKFIAINLAEEQANIYKLYDLLEAVLDELEHNDVEVNVPAWEDDTYNYAHKLFAAIHQALEKSGKKLVLLLDNIDRIFENLQEEASLFREHLLNYDDLKIIGGSTKMTEHFWKYNKPFYQFFRVLELKPLTSSEIKRLMTNWSEKLNLPELAEFIKNKPGQLETVRILTDGLPRTLQFFVNILLTRAQETGYEYLRLIMDSVTPLYQERLNSLPPSQRKIVLQLAFLWESVGAKELSEATKMDTKVISAQLKQLVEKGIADRINTSTKNHLYRISERFFNLWLIFTQGSPKEKRKAKCLTIFLENFYDAEEIIKLADEHLKMLVEGSPVANKAALMTKALAQSRYINFYVRDRLIDSTLALQDMAQDLRDQLPPTSEQIEKEVREAINKKDYQKAIKIVETIEQEDGFKESFLGEINFIKGDLIEAKRWVEKACSLNFIYYPLLAIIYDTLGEIQKAEELLLKGVDMNFGNAHYLLARFYAKYKRDTEAFKYYQIALDKEQWDASIQLANYHAKKGEYELVEHYLKTAIKQKIEGSALSLAVLYYCESKSADEISNFLDIEKSWSDKKSIDMLIFEIIFDISKGNLDNCESRTVDVLSKRRWGKVDFMLAMFLAQGQLQLLARLFENDDFGTELKEKYLPLYYATNIMRNKQNDSNLKVPPELKQTVDSILENVHNWTRNYV